MFLLPLILTFLGLFLFVKLKFFLFRHPVKTLGGCISAAVGRGGFASLALALAGTLGVGNILGVALCIIIGGAGSVFWLFVSGIFASVIKYAEVVISIDNLSQREGKSHGGMMYVIKNNLAGGRVLSYLYAGACLLLALFMGAAMQSSTAVSSAAFIMQGGETVWALVFVSLTVLSVLGGRDKIKKITACLIPAAALLYVFVTLVVIFKYFWNIPSVISKIMASAFDFRAVGGGVIGFLTASPVTRGYSTGILSNEAGAGTSSMAHSTAEDRPAAVAGLAGMCEVFVDTSLMCMLTAFAILLPAPDLSRDLSGVELVLESLSQAFPRADFLLFLSVLAFALATVVCWYYYAGECSDYLFCGKGAKITLPLYLAAVFFGAFFDSSFFAGVSDALLLLLTLLTLPVIIKSSDRIRYLSERYGIIKCESLTKEKCRKREEERASRSYPPRL